MKLENIIIENYRQFDIAELAFDQGITILAGANNSGKTSLINLIRSVFVDEKNDYSVSDIPAKNMQEWIDWGYPVFADFFKSGKSVDTIDAELVNLIIPEDDTVPSHLMNTTCVKIHVSYDPDIDDIKMFADYIMDLDEEVHDFYFLFDYEVTRSKFLRAITDNYDKLKRRFDEIEEDKIKLLSFLDKNLENNIEVKERYLKQLIVSIYVKSMVTFGYFCDKKFKNKCRFDDIKEFRKLFHFCFIKASRPLDDDELDHSHMLSKQMIRMVKLDDGWNELVERLPDELLKPIQEKKIDKTVRDTSLKSLKDTINALEQTNGGKSGELMLDMQVTEDDISELLQRITTATYNVDGYYLGESSQGLGYSNMIYIHLVIRHAGNFKSKLYDLSTLLKDLKKSENLSDKELANFFDWFFEIGYSEIVFADKAIFYEGDTERLFIRKAMTLEKYKKLSQQYVAFIQVGGAYAKNYEKLIRLLGIKSLIITDIDYEKEKLTVADIEDSTITNATIKHFYSLNHPTDNALVKNLYAWKNTKENIMDNLIYICFQTDHDGYARTLEEAMLNKYFSMSVTDLYKKSEWVQKRKDSKLDFSIPNKKNDKKISDEDMVSIRDILASTSGNKTDFMYSVIMNGYVENIMPEYIDGGLLWLMQ